MNYNLNKLNLEYAALNPALKIKSAPQYHKCNLKQLCYKAKVKTQHGQLGQNQKIVTGVLQEYPNILEY